MIIQFCVPSLLCALKIYSHFALFLYALDLHSLLPMNWHFYYHTTLSASLVLSITHVNTTDIKGCLLSFCTVAGERYAHHEHFALSYVWLNAVWSLQLADS